MTREEYYKQRSQYRTERTILMKGWDLNIKAHGEVIFRMLTAVEARYHTVVANSVRRCESYKSNIQLYRGVAVRVNSRGTRKVNVKKAGRK